MPSETPKTAHSGSTPWGRSSDVDESVVVGGLVVTDSIN
jgi:hypothetical protein